MRRFEVDWRRPTTVERCFPTRHADAPSVTRFQARETPLRHWGDEIVPVEDREIEKFLGDFDTDGVQAQVFGTRAAISVPIKSRERIAATALQLGAENVGRHGDMLPKEWRFPNRRSWLERRPSVGGRRVGYASRVVTATERRRDKKDRSAVCKPPLLVEAVSLQ